MLDARSLQSKGPLSSTEDSNSTFFPPLLLFFPLSIFVHPLLNFFFPLPCPVFSILPRPASGQVMDTLFRAASRNQVRELAASRMQVQLARLPQVHGKCIT